ncbi:hypothetical protein GCM10028809_58330 [Spirosoma gilvum]
MANGLFGDSFIYQSESFTEQSSPVRRGEEKKSGQPYGFGGNHADFVVNKALSGVNWPTGFSIVYSKSSNYR